MEDFILGHRNVHASERIDVRGRNSKRKTPETNLVLPLPGRRLSDLVGGKGSEVLSGERDF